MVQPLQPALHRSFGLPLAVVALLAALGGVSGCRHGQYFPPSLAGTPREQLAHLTGDLSVPISAVDGMGVERRWDGKDWYLAPGVHTFTSSTFIRGGEYTTEDYRTIPLRAGMTMSLLDPALYQGAGPGGKER
jgi:hypothetical protein